MSGLPAGSQSSDESANPQSWPRPELPDLEQLRVELQAAVRRLAHRRELEALRHHVDEAIGAFEVQQVQHAALVARLAATERRVLLLMEQAVGLWQPPTSSDVVVGARGWRRFFLRGRTGHKAALLRASSADRNIPPAALVLFEAAEYVAAHPESKDDPLAHYLRVGEPLGYRPNRWFDPLYYLEQNADVRAAGVSALLHFADHGASEERRPSEEFDIAWYLATYPEVRVSRLNPLLHFIAVGQALGFQPGPPGAAGGSQVQRP